MRQVGRWLLGALLGAAACSRPNPLYGVGKDVLDGGGTAGGTAFATADAGPTEGTAATSKSEGGLDSTADPTDPTTGAASSDPVGESSSDGTTDGISVCTDAFPPAFAMDIVGWDPGTCDELVSVAVDPVLTELGLVVANICEQCPCAAVPETQHDIVHDLAGWPPLDGCFALSLDLRSGPGGCEIVGVFVVGLDGGQLMASNVLDTNLDGTFDFTLDTRPSVECRSQCGAGGEYDLVANNGTHVPVGGSAVLRLPGRSNTMEVTNYGSGLDAGCEQRAAWIAENVEP